MMEKQQNISVSVVMPAFNEEKTITEIVLRVLNQGVVKQLIIVDDNSSDETRSLLKQFQQDSRVEVISLKRNRGKGNAIKEGLKQIKEKITIIQDADLEYDPNQYSKLINPIVLDYADVVYGSRFQTSEERRVLYFWHMLGNKFLTLISNAFTNLNLTDMETCFKAAKSEYFQALNIQEKRFGVEPEITAKFSAMRARFYEVSISYFGRTYDEGKKIHAKDGFRALYCIVKYNLPFTRKKVWNRFQGIQNVNSTL